jgi:hypothetical protein
MPRPTDKASLLDQCDQSFAALLALVDSLTPARQAAEYAFDQRDRNVRDTLAHLHAWHLMMLEWHRVGMSGATPDIPGKGYTWQTLPGLNMEIWESYQGVSLASVRKSLEASQDEVRRLIAAHPDRELFTKALHPWTKSTSLGAYFVSCTASHYDWAAKAIRKHARG